jgi:mono/diheme cytochrome c family protein
MRRQLLSAAYGALLAGGVWLPGGASVARAPAPPLQAASATSAPPPGAEPARPAKASETPVEAAALFSKMGCSLCHAPGARYHDRILGAAGKSEEDLVRWIRNPEKFAPGTTMPTYASLIDEPTARVLARWLKEGGPGAAAGKK